MTSTIVIQPKSLTFPVPAQQVKLDRPSLTARWEMMEGRLTCRWQ